MTTGRRLLGLLLLGAAAVGAGCQSGGRTVDPFTALSEKIGGAIDNASSPKLVRLARDRDEALQEIDSASKSIQAQELATGVAPGSPQAYENRLKEGQTFVDKLAPVLAEYVKYRQKLLAEAASDDLSEEESRNLLQATADIAALLDRWVAFNGAWREVQSVAAEEASVKLELRAPNVEGFPREVLTMTAWNQLPGFEQIVRSQLPPPTVVGNRPPPNYLNEAQGAIGQGHGTINEVERRRNQATGLMNRVLDYVP